MGQDLRANACGHVPAYEPAAFNHRIVMVRKRPSRAASRASVEKKVPRGRRGSAPCLLTLKFGSQSAYGLRPCQGRTFVSDELERYRVEFHFGPDGEVDELLFHQPNGTFVARRG